MTIKLFRQFISDKISEYTDIEEEILDLYYLAMSEIEGGGSEMHEINLAINSINEFIAQSNDTQVGWDVAKNYIHDVSGIVDHEEYWYKKENGVYYPQLRK